MRKKGWAKKRKERGMENGGTGFEAGRKARANERPGKSQKANDCFGSSRTGKPLKLAALRQLRVFLRGSICLGCLVAMAFFWPPPSGWMSGGESVASMFRRRGTKDLHAALRSGSLVAGVGRCGICFIWLAVMDFDACFGMRLFVLYLVFTDS